MPRNKTKLRLLIDLANSQYKIVGPNCDRRWVDGKVIILPPRENILKTKYFRAKENYLNRKIKTFKKSSKDLNRIET